MGTLDERRSRRMRLNERIGMDEPKDKSSNEYAACSRIRQAGAFKRVGKKEP